MPVKQEIIDHGWNDIVKQTKAADGSFTKVGYPREGRLEGGQGESDNNTMADLILVAAVQEFGSPSKNIPPRPTVSTTFDENLDELNRRKTKEYQRILDGKSTARQGLSRIGEWMVSKIRRKITQLKTPPNAPSTIAKKGSTNPLIDSGQMRQSVQHIEVKK